MLILFFTSGVGGSFTHRTAASQRLPRPHLPPTHPAPLSPLSPNQRQVLALSPRHPHNQRLAPLSRASGTPTTSFLPAREAGLPPGKNNRTARFSDNVGLPHFYFLPPPKTLFLDGYYFHRRVCAYLCVCLSVDYLKKL